VHAKSTIIYSGCSKHVAGFGSLTSPVCKVFPSVSEDFLANVISRFAVRGARAKYGASSTLKGWVSRGALF
jgi:hypothetical protein